MSNHKKNHQHNNHTLQQLAVGLQPLNLNVLDTPPVFTFTVTDYSVPEKPADVTPTQVNIELDIPAQVDDNHWRIHPI